MDQKHFGMCLLDASLVCGQRERQEGETALGLCLLLGVPRYQMFLAADKRLSSDALGSFKSLLLLSPTFQPFVL